MKKEVSDQLMQRTQEAYNQAAKEFSVSRAQFWHELSYLLEFAKHGERVLDIGCGNGRLFNELQSRGVSYTGLDYSASLVGLAQKTYPDGNFMLGDALELPFEDASFDLIYSFAVVHHIAGRSQQQQFFNEALRVLRPGGTLIVSSWDLWDIRHIPKMIVYYCKNLLTRKKPQFGDIVLSLGSTRGQRFVHSFRKSELKGMLNAFSVSIDCEIIPHGRRHSNLVCVVRK